MSHQIAVKGPLPLGAFVKLCGAASTGGEAKRLIQGGAVRVNGLIELRRGHEVVPGDLVELGGDGFIVVLGDEP